MGRPQDIRTMNDVTAILLILGLGIILWVGIKVFEGMPPSDEDMR